MVELNFKSAKILDQGFQDYLNEHPRLREIYDENQNLISCSGMSSLYGIQLEKFHSNKIYTRIFFLLIEKLFGKNYTGVNEKDKNTMIYRLWVSPKFHEKLADLEHISFYVTIDGKEWKVPVHIRWNSPIVLV